MQDSACWRLLFWYSVVREYNTVLFDLFHIKQYDHFSKKGKNKILMSQKRFEWSIITAIPITKGSSFFFAIKWYTLM